MMKHFNSAIIQDEAIVSVVRSVEGGEPVRPSFLHALGDLVEACVLHDRVFLASHAPGLHGEPRPPRETIEDMIFESDLVQVLMKEEVVTTMPPAEIIDGWLRENKSEYTYGDFMRDYKWTLNAFPCGAASVEVPQYRRLVFLMNQCPSILRDRSLTGEDDEITNADAAMLVANGMPFENLVFLEGLNHRAGAYVDLARNLGMHLYLYDSAVPHQIGAIRASNGKAREVVRKLESELKKIDGEGMPNEFTVVRVPALVALVLKRCMDNPQGIVDEILVLREEHRNFRDWLTSYEREWSKSSSYLERKKLMNDFENSWTAIAKLESEPSTRLIYKVWDIIKEPTKILKATGDLLAGKGKQVAVIEQVRGLHAFWKTLLDSPVREMHFDLLSRMFTMEETEAWEEATRFSASLEAYIGAPNSAASADQKSPLSSR